MQASVATSVTNAVTLAQAGTNGALTLGGSTPLTFSGAVTVTGANTLTLSNPAGTTFSGALGGTGSINANVGTLTPAQSAVVTFGVKINQ